MRLFELNARFLKFTKQPGVLKMHDDFVEAQGIWFECPNPSCRKKSSLDGDRHAYTLLFPNAPQVQDPKSGKMKPAQPLGRWTALGKYLEDLTLLEIIRGHCGWRGCIRDGAVRSTLTQ